MIQGVALALVVLVLGLTTGSLMEKENTVTPNNTQIPGLNGVSMTDHPVSTEGSGQMTIHEVKVRDELSNASYEVYIGLIWEQYGPDDPRYEIPLYLERYSSQLLDNDVNSTVSAEMVYSYRWDPSVYNQTTFMPVIWVKLVNSRSNKTSMNGIMYHHWSYGLLVDHNSNLYYGKRWFWLSPDPPEGMLGTVGEDFGGAVTLKFKITG